MFQILFYPKNVCVVLPIDKFYNRSVFLPKSMTGLYVTFIDIYTYFSKNIVRFIFQILVSDRRRYTNNFNSAWRDYWALAQHCLSVCTTLSISFEFKFFVTAKSASSFLKYLSRSFTSVIRFVICEAKPASVYSTSCTSSDFLSLFRTASVWVVAMTIDTLQYLQN